jgi:predicted acylesterase/phospholipase RssA
MQSSRQNLVRFVLAMSAYNMNGGSPCLFRTYPANANAMPDCNIWEVLRATMTHPSLFKGIEIGKAGLRERFVQGGLGCGNPTSYLLDEAKRLFPGRKVACIISIGAGHARTIAIPKISRLNRALRLESSVSRALEATHGMATDNERVADEMSKRFADAKGFYYRLNVNQGMQGIEASEWERLDEVVAHTRAYMRQLESDRSLDAIVEAVRKRNATLDAIDIGEITLAQ